MKKMCQPTLYVYNLSDTFRDPRQKTLGVTANTTAYYKHGHKLFDTGNYALGEVFLARARQYACRVHRAADADLFFIPAYSARFFDSVSLGVDLFRELDAITVGNTTALQKNGGNDHFMIQPRIGASYERSPYKELNYRDTRLLCTHRLSLEQMTTHYGGTYNPEWFYESVPYPSHVRSPWRSSKRTRLVTIATSPHGRYRLLRKTLLHQCRARPTACAIGSTDNVHDLYASSTFCLQPPGDSVSRRGVIDSLLVGCIPVFFHEEQLDQWPWHFRAWASNASVLFGIPHSGQSINTNIIDELSHVRHSDVFRMRESIEANSMKLMYSIKDTNESDAFVVTLRELWHRSKLGLHQHRTCERHVKR